jgi:hypothetical protein
MFSELDEALLPWLPYVVPILLGAWLLYEAGEATKEAEENPQGDDELDREDSGVGEQSQQPLEPLKPLTAKKAAKASKLTMTTLIAEESRKRSK